ncbi:MAG: hypothetical protein IKG87_15395 [Clostridia bacterium]|nr:hypothetical protein [Clostridia bacterium]
MRISLGAYDIQFENGGIRVIRDGRVLYFNARPVYVSVKTYAAIIEFRDQPYDRFFEKDGSVTGEALFITGNGSEIKVCDTYTACGGALKIVRSAAVVKQARDDLGFQTKVSFYQAVSDELKDFDCFSPGQWYRNNEYAADFALGKDLDLQYFWRKETWSGLPMFAMQHKRSGETVAMSRWAADATLPSLDRTATENYAYVDEKMTVGSFGVSKARPEALTYTYYGHMMATPLPDTACDGVSIDYIYPAVNGQLPYRNWGPVSPRKPVSNITWVHPMREGFEQHYAVAVTFGCYDGFGAMMRATWREAYPRLKDRLYEVDNALLYENMMRFLESVTRQFGEAWGTPFAAQLPDFDPSSFSAEIGFVGQQAGIGYQLLRWGRIRDNPDAVEKGLGILDYWTGHTMTDAGFPNLWVHLSVHQNEPQPLWIRQIGDGMEAVLDAFVFETRKGIRHDGWLSYCIRTADWLLKAQNGDGSFYRSYHDDGNCCMDSKASTPCVIRFLIQLYLVTGNNAYLQSAVRAGEWAYRHVYQGFEYRGGPCDTSDIMDKESGIYAMFAFMALYDVTTEPKWLEAACGAADYTETFTFVWHFPVHVPYPAHPFNRTHISGQSNVSVGTQGGDIYMAACSYAYYRLWLMTGDRHYCDFAEFLNRNCKQANDPDGSFGYRYAGLVNEGAAFSEQEYRSRYHWLPWCTFVEADPAARFFDTFGAYEIAEIERLPEEEKQARNRIYEHYSSINP